MAILARLDQQNLQPHPPDFTTPRNPQYHPSFTQTPVTPPHPPLQPNSPVPPSIVRQFSPIPFHLSGFNSTQNWQPQTPTVTGQQGTTNPYPQLYLPPPPPLQPNQAPPQLFNHDAQFPNQDNQQTQLMPIKWRFDFPKFNGDDPHE